MTRLFVVVEGQSEERFVRETLRPHVSHLDPVAILVETGRTQGGPPARGGGDWSKWLADIRRSLPAGSRDRVVTTMFDLYGLPKNFPNVGMRSGYADTSQFADALERSMSAAVADARFVPNLIVHEFEALVLAALPELELLLPPSQRTRLAPLRRAVKHAGPEDINSGDTTHPSQRLADADISYSKLTHGVPAVHALGVNKLKVACPRFGAWIAKLERL